MSDFWDHLFGAIEHGMNASSLSRAEREQARAERRGQKHAHAEQSGEQAPAESPTAPFGAVPVKAKGLPDGCCVTKRRFKRG